MKALCVGSGPTIDDQHKEIREACARDDVVVVAISKCLRYFHCLGSHADAYVVGHNHWDTNQQIISHLKKNLVGLPILANFIDTSNLPAYIRKSQFIHRNIIWNTWKGPKTIFPREVPTLGLRFDSTTFWCPVVAKHYYKCDNIAFVGTGYRVVNGKKHYSAYPGSYYIENVDLCDKHLAKEVNKANSMKPTLSAVNCAPGSRMTVFPHMDLREWLNR